jgi:hypothetical protein
VSALGSIPTDVLSVTDDSMYLCAGASCVTVSLCSIIPTSTLPIVPSTVNIEIPVGGGGVPESVDEVEISKETLGWLSRNKTCPPTDSARTKLVEEGHLMTGHAGRAAVYAHIFNTGYWWMSMHKTIASILDSCDQCRRFNLAKHGYHPAKFIHVKGPGDHWQIDTGTNMPKNDGGFNSFLIAIELYTGFVILRALIDHTGPSVAMELNKIFCLMGYPKVLQSDNGTEFLNSSGVLLVVLLPPTIPVWTAKSNVLLVL